MGTTDTAEAWATAGLAALDRRYERVVDACPYVPAADTARRLQRLDAERERLLAGGLPARPDRRVPSLHKIAEFHDLGDLPRCFRCGFTQGGTWRDATSWLERAHVIDRSAGGLDNLVNLRPLCRWCHRCQPSFVSGDEQIALAWFSPDWPELDQ